jgi:hypothetical protein
MYFLSEDTQACVDMYTALILSKSVGEQSNLKDGRSWKQIKQF